MSPDNQAQPGSRAKILIVEDEGTVAAHIQMCLERLGYDVVGIADTGQDALDLARDHQPDLVTMDVILQGSLDGIQTADRLRKTRDIPVVFLTSLSDTLTMQRAKTTAPYAYLIKPFQEHELRLALEIALCRHAADVRPRRCQRAIDSMPVALIVSGPSRDGYPVIDVNATMQAWTGYSIRELTAQNRSLTSVLQATDPAALEQMAAGNHSGWIPAQLRRSDDSVIPCEAACSAVCDGFGQPREITWIAKTCTDPAPANPGGSRRANLESFGDIVPDAKRDLNGSLAPVAMALRVLKERHPDESSLLDVIEASVGNASDIIRTLQDNAKKSGGFAEENTLPNRISLRAEANLAKGP